MSRNEKNNTENTIKRISDFTMQMNPNNYGQIVGTVAEIMPVEHKRNKRGQNYTITPLRLTVMSMGRAQDIVVLLYDCSYTDMFEKGHVLQVMYHIKTRQIKLKSGRFTYATDLVADSVRVIALNTEISYEYPEEYYHEDSDDENICDADTDNKAAV